ncbi:uncharacterized protein LOC132193328 [Neocloeon triangulifer]|uniref:uncharacterized protein LOC132193328 n=1 Tax=Neocloeon triangulifer TaxID=2078957 RepID=UPI00286F1CEE|nr:uncharacterized protein LOC132193328 [Neocloeon triangulifer]
MQNLANYSSVYWGLEFGREHDSNEFAMSICTKIASIIEEAKRLNMKIVVNCSSCSEPSTIIIDSPTMQVHPHCDTSLQTLITDFLYSEMMEKQCKNSQCNQKTMECLKMPQFIIIEIGRAVEGAVKNNFYIRIQPSFKVPQLMRKNYRSTDFVEYSVQGLIIQKGYKITLENSKTSGKDKDPIESGCQSPKTKVAKSTKGGHFYSIVKEEGDWFKLNDDRVRKVMQHAIENRKTGKGVCLVLAKRITEASIPE